MSEHAQQRHPHSEPEDDASPGRPAGPSGQRQAPSGHRAPRAASSSASGDDSGVSGDEPGDEDEFALIGDDDLGIADLGPIAPGTVDPDAGSGRIRKVTEARGRQPR